MDDGHEHNPQRAVLLTLAGSLVFSGSINSNECIEWDWDRVPVALGMGTAKDHLLLKRGKEEFQSEFRIAQVSWEEFHYRGIQAEQNHVGRHTMESGGFMLMICLMPTRRSVRQKSKQAALQVLKGILDACMHAPLWGIGLSITVQKCISSMG